jgi:hypothetical protein
MWELPGQEDTTGCCHIWSDSIHSSTSTCPSPARHLQVIRPFVERGFNGLPFAHNKSHGSRRYRAAHGDIAGRCERTGGGEGQHRKQCTRSPRTGERERCVAKAQRTAPPSIRSRGLQTVAGAARRSDPDWRLGNNSLVPLSAATSRAGTRSEVSEYRLRINARPQESLNKTSWRLLVRRKFCTRNRSLNGAASGRIYPSSIKFRMRC